MMLKTFGIRIKTLRENGEITQAQLSALTGVGREQISRIENGLINPTLETVFKLSMALNISLSELFKGVYSDSEAKKEYTTKPFVKWAGGKTQILEEIKELMPLKYNTYFEPFLGGGAVLFNLTPNKAVVSDYNEELITTYQCFKDEKCFKLMIEELKKHEENHNEEYYYQIREMDRSKDYKDFANHLKAARMIYLNKACFNGLYWVNSKGYFNVPSGKKEKVVAYNELLFKEIHEYFKTSNITILSGDFEKAVKTARKGDFVYFDPPYDTLVDENNFTSYTKDSFGKDEQKRLSEVFKKLAEKGVYVMLSNHNTNYIQKLYEGFNIKVIFAKRMINSKGTGRGPVEEVIITNY